MSYERRGLRPFDTMDETQKLLNDYLRIQSPPIPDGFIPPLGALALTPYGVNTGSIAGNGGTLVLDAEQYVSNSFGLYFGVHEDHWGDFTSTVGREIDKIFGRRQDAPVNLLVTAINRRLKQLVVLLDIPFQDWISSSQEWRWNLVKAGDSAERPRPLRMPNDGCDVVLQFVLREDLPERFRVRGRPWRKGSWLARATIKVTAGKGSGLAPRPLTPEIRKVYGLGDRCTSFIDFRGEPSGLCMHRDLSDVLSVYIDENLLSTAGQMKPNGESANPAGSSIFARLVMDTYRTLVFALWNDEDLDQFDVDDEQHRYTFTYSMLDRVASYSNISIEEALNILKDSPSRFSSLVEGSIDILSSDSQLLQLGGH